MIGLKRDILYDLDGTFSAPLNSLTRPRGTVVWGYKHLTDDSACTPATMPGIWDDSIVCD